MSLWHHVVQHICIPTGSGNIQQEQCRPCTLQIHLCWSWGLYTIYLGNVIQSVTLKLGMCPALITSSNTMSLHRWPRPELLMLTWVSPTPTNQPIIPHLSPIQRKASAMLYNALLLELWTHLLSDSLQVKLVVNYNYCEKNEQEQERGWLATYETILYENRLVIS